MTSVEDTAEAMCALLESFGHGLRATPVMNGYDAARPIKARLPAWPYFAAVTGAAEDGVEAAMRQAGSISVVASWRRRGPCRRCPVLAVRVGLAERVRTIQA